MACHGTRQRFSAAHPPTAAERSQREIHEPIDFTFSCGERRAGPLPYRVGLCIVSARHTGTGVSLLLVAPHVFFLREPVPVQSSTWKNDAKRPPAAEVEDHHERPQAAIGQASQAAKKLATQRTAGTDTANRSLTGAVVGRQPRFTTAAKHRGTTRPSRSQLAQDMDAF